MFFIVLKKMTAYREGQHITPKYFKKLQDKTEPVKRIMGGVNVSVWVLVSVCFLSFFLLGRTVRRVGRKTQKREKMFALKDSLMNI